MVGADDKYDPQKHHRRSVRLRGYDYAQAGAYFVTICAWQKECVLGIVQNGSVVLSSFGRIVDECWRQLPCHFSHVEPDVCVVMPNHVHGIIVITGVGAGSPRPGSGSGAATGGAETAPLQCKPALGHIVGYFKYQSTKRINELRHTPRLRHWQRNYYEHVIRAEDDLGRIREYIEGNAAKWDTDEENPDCVRPAP